jgi:MurNAc alpha-1-phosphate uridylyltransferase
VGEKAMLDHALDRLKDVGVQDVVVNVHYLAEQIIAHVAHRTTPHVHISDERRLLLETGGGVKKALNQLGCAPFWLMNSDTLWIEKNTSALHQMRSMWQPEAMDILLLLADVTQTLGYDGQGDFHVTPDQQLIRRSTHENAPFVYAGAAILKPELFKQTPEGAFSMNHLFDEAIARKRLFGTVLNGTWLHVGTPQALEDAEAFLKTLNEHK